MIENNRDISIKEAINDLLETSIFKNITKRNDEAFAKKLAIWLIRYILVISSMKESLRIDLESVLINIHGEKLRKIIEITDKAFHNTEENTSEYDSYIQ